MQAACTREQGECTLSCRCVQTHRECTETGQPPEVCLGIAVKDYCIMNDHVMDYCITYMYYE